MKPMEDELRWMLRRKDPPDGFAERVLARVTHQTGGKARPWLALWRRPVWRWAAAAAFACVLILASVQYHQRQEGEIARAQAILALRIASSQLNGTLKAVVQMSPPRTREGSIVRSSGPREPLL
jgi:anti-sigma-K factor RskA